MTCREWREAYERLAELYFDRTGEFPPQPTHEKGGKEISAVLVSDGLLEKLYVERKMKITEIADFCGCSKASVSAMLKKAGIRARTIGDYPRTPAQIASGERLGESSKGIGRKGRPAKRSEPKIRSSRFIDCSGYVQIYWPEHPMATKSGCVREHRLVMMEHLGRELLPDEVVHHINGIKHDNRIENLMVMKAWEHDRLTAREHPPTFGKRPETAYDQNRDGSEGGGDE